MGSIMNKRCSILVILSLTWMGVLRVPYTEGCGTCGTTPKPPPSPPPPATKGVPCPPPPAPAGHGQSYCPRDALKLGVCADLLGVVHVVVGNPPSGSKCCALLTGLTDLEAAACLCTAIKANVLGVKLDVPVALSVLLSACQKTLPSGFTCK